MIDMPSPVPATSASEQRNALIAIEFVLSPEHHRLSGRVRVNTTTPRQMNRSNALSTRSTLALLALAVGLSACSSGNAYKPGPPTGWEADGTRWWIPGSDTSVAFRPMRTLEQLGVSGASQVFVASDGISRRSSADQSVRAVKQSLLPLFRNEPRIVDSLFTVLVEEKIRTRPFAQTDFDENVTKWKKETIRSIRRIFHEPFPKKKLGTDIVIVYPDSLSKAGVSGNVEMQVYLNREGAPQGIELISPVHPVLDDIAMMAATEMLWQPAYLLTEGKSNAVPAWVRYNVNFTQAATN